MKTKEIEKHGFIVAEINGRFNCLLRKEEYLHLLGSSSYEDLIIRLTNLYSYVQESKDILSLKNNLIMKLKEEALEYNNFYVQYFLEYFQIQNFFNKIKLGKTNELGNFPSLNAVNISQDFLEIEKLVIKESFLIKYYKEEYKKYNYQRIWALIIRNFMNFYYEKSEGYFREILEKEGDLQILEIFLSSLENKKECFPKNCSISNFEKENLNSLEDFYKIYKLKKDPVKELNIRIFKSYSESFNQFNDLSCIYSYLRLKEQEISNILYIVNNINEECYEELIIIE